MNSSIRPLTNEYLRSVVATHLDEANGAPYWVRKAKAAGVRAPEEIRSFDDFKRVFAFTNRKTLDAYERDLRELPLEEFIPRSVRRSERWIWASETGGTTGIPKRGTWGSAYWERIMEFSDEFLDLHGVPRGENWLFVGPTGPHTTGRLMISIAERRGGLIYCIDMDPRIVRRFLYEGRRDAVSHYVKHIWEQVDPILRHQQIGVLFCTATLLEMLPRYVETRLLDRVKAVTHAGLAMARDTDRYLREELFPGKPVVGIYGTSVSGISFQKPSEPDDGNRVVYIPSQPYLVLEVIDASGRLVQYGEEGDVRCFRFTDDSLIPGFIERDRATRIKPFGAVASRYQWDWIGDPHSPESLSGQTIEGVY